jgi:hypothetical protein
MGVAAASSGWGESRLAAWLAARGYSRIATSPGDRRLDASPVWHAGER